MDTGGDEDCGHWGGGGLSWGGGSFGGWGHWGGVIGGGVTTMKRCDEDWSLGGGSLEGVGWWSLEGVVVMGGGGVFTEGGWWSLGAPTMKTGVKMQKTRRKKTIVKTGGECMDTVLCH